MRVEVLSQQYFLCPTCKEHRFWVCPEKKDNFKWICDCGQALRVDVHDGCVDVELLEKFERVIDVVRMPPQKSPVFFLVPSLRQNSDHGGSAEFLYNENSCPINTFRKSSDVYAVEDFNDGTRGLSEDPHGIVQYVTTFYGDMGESDIMDALRHLLVEEVHRS